MGPQLSQSLDDRDQLATLTHEVTQLRDLFQRRLLEDKAKNKLYEELYAQLQITRGGLAEQLLAPLFRELLLVVGRVTSLAREGNDVLLESVRDELLELLERRELRPVPSTGTFDAAIHEAVRSEPRDDQPPGTVLEVLRSGYFLNTQLLRAERVVVATARDRGTRAESSTGAVTSEQAEPELS